MRSASRAYLAVHPRLALCGFVFRWTIWFLVGHPVGIMALLAALLFRVPLLWVPTLAVVADRSVWLLGRRDRGRLWRGLRVWNNAARFQRRWPAAFAEASLQRPHDRPLVFSGFYYASPDGLRPALAAPVIRPLPTSISNTSMTWEVRPWSAQTFADFGRQVDIVAVADDRVVSANVAGRLPSQRRRWDLTVNFFETGSGFEPWDGVFDSERQVSPGDSDDGRAPSPRYRHLIPPSPSSEG